MTPQYQKASSAHKRVVLEEMRSSGSFTVPLHQIAATFLKVTTSYWLGLFHCYNEASLPRTNNIRFRLTATEQGLEIIGDSPYPHLLEQLLAKLDPAVVEMMLCG